MDRILQNKTRQICSHLVVPIETIHRVVDGEIAGDDLHTVAALVGV